MNIPGSMLQALAIGTPIRHLATASRRVVLLAAAAICLFYAGSGAAAPPPWSPDPGTPDVWLRLQRASWVAQGSTHPQHILYVITDANCPFCHDLWLSLQPLYAENLQVRYIMVGILARNSPGKAAAILEAKNPSQALDRNERRWASLPDDLGGGIPPLRTPRPATLAAIASNEALMHDLGARGTPALIYRDTAHAMHVVQSSLDAGKLKVIIAASST